MKEEQAVFGSLRVASAEVIGVLVASSAVHLLLVIPTLITLQIYDRVLTSRRGETLVMLLFVPAPTSRPNRRVG
ncbi:hypothetical protein [Variovorax sp. RA8]|uniref:hypothetical protein n=1 Tax=Variovorax sp. (strain JCM 16519 / RA8) TaxID=662548 RepID=UPI0013A57DC2|nr:hypothetical protein [Variovorax sp. RA8]